MNNSNVEALRAPRFPLVALLILALAALVGPVAGVMVGGPLGASTAWSGEITVTADVTLVGPLTLTIEAGARLLMYKGVSVVAATGACLRVLGTAGNEVSISAAQDGENWGAFVALGNNASLTAQFADVQAGQFRVHDGANGVIEDSYFHDYLVANVYFHEYSIVYTHQATQITMRRCHFKDYFQVNFYNTPALVEDCLFEYWLDDAIDFDNPPAQTVLRRCTLRHGIGLDRDAIDFGKLDFQGNGPRGLVQDCLVYDITDKGVSIGEGSAGVTVLNTLIHHAGTGVAVKDSSIGVLTNVTAVHCTAGIAAYEKNAGLGGGHGTCVNAILWDNGASASVASDSSFAVSYSDLEGVPTFPGVGNINSDPLFVDPANNDFRVLAGSPALTAGLNQTAMGVQFPVGGPELTAQELVLGTPHYQCWWDANTTQDITWSAGAGVSSVFIEYSTNSGGAWMRLADTVPAALGKYPWIVPNVWSTQCKVRIGDAADPLNAVSNYGWFVIAPTGDVCALPTLSHPAGFYADPLALAFAPPPGVSVYYTLDGSEPTEQSPCYTAPIPITAQTISNSAAMQDIVGGSAPHVPLAFIRSAPASTGFWKKPVSNLFQATVVRWRAYQPGRQLSPIMTHTYFVAPDMPTRFSLPIISLATDKDNFFDYHKGIYIVGVNSTPFTKWGFTLFGNYEQRGRDWERLGNIELFETNGTRGFSVNIGMRIRGELVRDCAEKSLTIFARSEYDAQKHFDYALFPGLLKHETTEPMLRFKRFMLRNAGSEWGASYNTMCRDAAVQALFGNTHAKIQAYRPALVFLNGEYWGIHNMRELNDERGLESTYGVDPTNVIMMEDNFDGTGQLTLGTPLDASNYYTLRGFIKTNDLRIQANYDYVAARMDLENFCDYWLAQIYADNESVTHNVSYWRLWTPGYDTLTNAPYGHDGRWRWVINDMDRAFGGFGSSTAYTADMLSQVAINWSRDFLFKKIVSNDIFKVHFINRFADLLNTSLKEQVVTQHIGAVQTALRGDMQEHLSRWGTPASLATWNANMQIMTTFGLNRPRYQRAHITNFFRLPGVATVVLNVSDSSRGSLRINTIEINQSTPGVNDPAAPYPWTGIYFRGVPIQLTAEPAFGCRFSGWNSVATTDPVFTVTLTSNATFVAQFELDTNILAQIVPQPHVLANTAYAFTTWDAGAPTSTYPTSMLFEQTATLDPGLEVAMDSTWILPYNLTSRSRINGLGSRGIAFVNTANAQNLPGAGFLGTALLALNSVSQNTVRVAWTAQTILTNSRVYGLRMQARTGNTGAFASVLGLDVQPLEFLHSTTADWEEHFGPVALPPALCNQQYVQLRWKYYYIAGDDGSRPELRLDDIYVFSAAPFVAPDALVLPRASGDQLPVGQPANIVWDGAKLFPSLNGMLTRIDQLAVYDAASHAAVAVIATNLAASATNCVWVPPASLLENPSIYCIGMVVQDNPAGTASRLFTENLFTVLPEPGIGLGALALLAICAAQRKATEPL